VKNWTAFPAESLLSIGSLCSQSCHGVRRHGVTLELVSLDVLRVVVVEDANGSEHVGTTELYWTRKWTCVHMKPLRVFVSKYDCYCMRRGSFDAMKPGERVALACTFRFTRKWFIITFQLRNRGSIPAKGRRFSVQHSFLTGLGAYPASYSVDTEGSLPQSKSPGCEADDWRPLSVDVKNWWSFISTPPCFFVACTGTTVPTCLACKIL